MKKNFKIFISIIILTSFASCSKQLLEKTPLDIITSDVVWNDQALIDAYLTGAYSDMYVFELDNTHHITSSDGAGGHFTVFAINSISDEAWSTHTWSFNANAYKNGGLKINGGLLEWWDEGYKVIRVLNEFIENVSAAPVDPSFKTERVAEARFLRAYAYFALVERYGGVPLITKVQNIDAPKDSINRKRATEQAVYDFVISECKSIADVLPETQSATDYGRPSKYAALALECRAALYAGSIANFGMVQLDGVVGIDQSKKDSYYQLAYDAADQIIKGGLFELYDKYADDKVKNFRQLFIDEMPQNREVIFARPHDNISPDKNGNGWTYDFFQAPTPNAWGQGTQDGPYLETAEVFEHVDGSSGKLDFASIEQGLWTMEELWANKDPRFYASIFTMNTIWQGKKLDGHNGILKPDGTVTTQSFNGILGKGPSNLKTGFGVMKYLDESFDNMGDFTTSSQDYIIFRYGEILLNFAEAAFNLGKTNDALDAVNQIRERAGIALLTSVNEDKIRHERQVELMFEGHRYWDLRRWRIATEVLSVNRSGLRYIQDAGTGKFKLSVIHNMDGTVSTPQFYPQNYYLPVTLDRTSKNHNLVENPGYH